MNRVDLQRKPQPVPLLLGMNPFDGRPVYFEERSAFGVHVIMAPTRVGKSIVAANLFTQISQFRPVIVFDYLGEHASRRYPNCLSMDLSGCVPDLTVIKRPRFKISQFNEVKDWRSIGFSGRAAQLMAYLAKHQDSHMDDVELFKDMVDDLPISPVMLERFRVRYGFEVPVIHSGVVQSAQTTMTYLLSQEFFQPQMEEDIDIGLISQTYPNMVIDFGLDQTQVGLARAIAGKCMKQVIDALHLYRVPPLLVFEEADVLFPNTGPDDDGELMSSVYYAVQLVLKLQKKRLELLFIIQSQEQLYYAITQNAHSIILGPDKSHEIGRVLKCDITRNYREFAIIRAGVPGYDAFVPLDSMTMY